MIELKQFKVGPYNITYDFDFHKVYGIYASNPVITKEFLLKYAGINKSEGCYYNNQSVFDNKRYFDERVFIDCEYDYMDTLVTNHIATSINNRYGKILNVSRFEKYVKSLSIRSEGEYDVHYNFSKEGKALANTSLALSLYGDKIIYCPLENINNERRLNILEKDLADCKGAVIGINTLAKYHNVCDAIIILANNFHVILEKDKELIVIYRLNNEEIIAEQLGINNNILFRSIKSESLILTNTLTIEQIKKLNDNKIKMKKISVFDLEQYL